MSSPETVDCCLVGLHNAGKEPLPLWHSHLVADLRTATAILPYHPPRRRRRRLRQSRLRRFEKKDQVWPEQCIGAGSMECISWRDRAGQLKQEIRALMIAIRDPRVPWYAKLLGIGIVAYALSPLDLIPDPIPVLGYLDDIIILPLAILLVLRLIPSEVMADARKVAAGEEVAGGRLRWIGAGLIILFWIGTVALLLLFASRFI